ncbi:MAG: hypothetical protein J6U86_05100 [Clostridia bacterium]|nr:hypothetical protein [Clostridia bacterium]
MKKLINAVTGDDKNTSPARKYTAYALLITAIALALALVVLIVSSIAFAVSDKDGGEVVDNAAGEGGDNDDFSGSASSSALQYEVVTAEDVAEELDELVNFTERKDREVTAGTNNLYYAKSKDVKSLSAGTMYALDSMLKNFYNNNKSKLNPDVGPNSDNKECDIPLVIDSNASGTSFKLVVFGNDKTTFNDAKYTWIYDNAYRYGFVAKDNTFTYVGVAVANYMRGKSLTSLDAIEASLSGKPVSVSAIPIGESKATSFQIYYISASATEFKLPSNYKYTVIANGDKGYVVTVNMSEKIQTTQTTTSDGGLG